MAVRTFALLAGFTYLVVGLLGFFPGVTQPPPPEAPPVAIPTTYGYLLGLFPINVWHNFFHLAVGVWGMVVYRRFSAARAYARGLAILYSLLTVLGLFPGLHTLFGLMPIFGHALWLHGLTAIIALYCGWLAPAEVSVQRVAAIRPNHIRSRGEQPSAQPHL